MGINENNDPDCLLCGSFGGCNIHKSCMDKRVAEHTSKGISDAVGRVKAANKLGMIERDKATLARIHKILDDEEARLKKRLDDAQFTKQPFALVETQGSLATVKKIRSLI